jgi:hypothetical protein
MVDDGYKLRKQHVSRDAAFRLSEILLCQVTRHLKDDLLQPVRLSIRIHRNVFESARPVETGSTFVGRQQTLHLNFWWYLVGIKRERRKALPIHRHAVTNGLTIAFDTGKSDLICDFFRKRVHPMTLLRRGGGTVTPLKWNYLKRHAEYLGDFLG